MALAVLHVLPLLLLCTLAGGMAWLAMMSCLTVAAQTAAPGWVRARALSVYLLFFAGVQAVGSVVWGAAAERFGNMAALVGAALVLVFGLVATRRWPLQRHQGLDLSPGGHWTDPTLAITPEPEDGPVLITVEYRVPADRSAGFLAAMEAMHTFRRREGAISWGLFRDLAEPERYVETFLVTTWAEHMRQHVRVTVEDQAIEARAFAFQREGITPVAAHLIAARADGGKSSTESPYTELS